MSGGCSASTCGCGASADVARSVEERPETPVAVAQTQRVSIDGVEVTESEIRAEIQYHPAPSFAAARAEAVRALVVRQLLVREARRQGLLDDEAPVGSVDLQACIDALVAREAPVPTVSEAELRDFFESHRDRFRSPPLASVSHILFGAPPDDAEARAHAKRDAEATLAQLIEHSDRFESLAEKRSACPSARQRGSLGQISPGDLVPEIERALARMEPGELLGETVETTHGHHILRLDARAPGRPLPFSAARAKIETYLRDRAWRARVHAWVAQLAADATIEGCTL